MSTTAIADRPLRIVFVSRQFWPVAHGAETQMLRLAAALKREGHDVRVLSSRLDPRWPRREILESGLPLLRLPSPRIRGLGTFFFLLSLASYLILRCRKIDVLHISTLKYAATLGGFMGPMLGIPVLGRGICAGTEGDMAHVRTLPTPGLVMKGLHRLDRVIALSTEIREELRANGFNEKRIALIPNAVDDIRFHVPSAAERVSARALLPKAVGSRLVTVTTARLVQQKGIEYLIDAYRAAGMRENWASIILGSGDLRSELQAQVVRAGLEHDVFFPGSVSDVRPWLHAADVFCLPSLYEGLSNALIEAMASGLAIVATRVSGTVDLIEDGTHGMLVDPEHPEQIAKALMRMTDPALRERLARAARRRVEEACGLREIARRYVDLYRTMIAIRNRR